MTVRAHLFLTEVFFGLPRAHPEVPQSSIFEETPRKDKSTSTMVIFHDRFSKAALVLVAALSSLLFQGAQARRWEDVIEVSIYAQSHVDLPRIQFAIEENPLNVAPTFVLLESQPPSDAPSSVPSYFKLEELDEPNSNYQAGSKCPEGGAVYTVNMHDTWGDGWGETTLSIREIKRIDNPVSNHSSQVSLQKRSFNPSTNHWSHRELENFVFRGGVKEGDFDSRDVCLSQAACYEVTLENGKWTEEAKWEILPVISEEGNSRTASQAVAKGRGLSNCTFHVSEYVNSGLECPFTCRPQQEPEQEEASEEAEEEGEEGEVQGESTEQIEADLATPGNQTSPDLVEEQEALEPSTAPSDEEALEPSTSPSDAPSLVPTMM